MRHSQRAMCEYAVVDVETTGFSPTNGDRILEIAVVVVHADGSIRTAWDTLVNPLRDVGASFVHGIDDDDVAVAPEFADVAGALAELCAGRVVVAHNLQFDSRFISAEYSRLGHDLGLSSRTGLCTMRMAKRELAGKGTCTLDACCRRYGIERRNAHKALDDALATARLLGVFTSDPAFPESWSQEIAESTSLLWPSAWPSLPPLSRS